MPVTIPASLNPIDQQGVSPNQSGMVRKIGSEK
jgi:hypothetical protein